MMKNSINWFEIPVQDFERAKKFYENLFDAKMETQNMEDMGMKMAFFPADWENGIGGGIVHAEGYEPSENGSLVYLNGGNDLSVPLSRIKNSGAKILMDKTSLGPNGFMAQFIDSEGNRVALHSYN